MPSIDSAHPQKVDDMLRNQWTTCSGFGGRLAPDSLVAFDRITQPIIILFPNSISQYTQYWCSPVNFVFGYIFSNKIND